MDTIPTSWLFFLLVFLIICSAFFSSSETSMLSLNRYRLKHLTKKKHAGAMRVSSLLQRPDRLIGVILIGNNLVNIFATLVAGIITTHLFGEWIAVVIMPFVLTFIILVFAEVTPKTVAAVFPERIAFPASFVLKPLLTLLYPAVVAVNYISNSLAKLFGLDPTQVKLSDNLNPEELRTVVDESGDLIPEKHQGMLLNVLDLEKTTVEDVMIPRNDVTGIDLEADIHDILALIRSTDYTRLPVYHGDLDKVVGVLHLRKSSRFLTGTDDEVTKDDIIANTSDPYFIPESTSLTSQLMYFQKEKRRVAMVVDEYGQVQGIVTLVDILEEIVGDLNPEETEEAIIDLDGKNYLISAHMSIRDINRQLGWDLPTDGPKTLNGIIVEHLENIPASVASFTLGGYRFEITHLSDTRIEKARVCKDPLIK